MSFSMIERARDRWFDGPACTVGPLVAGIERAGKLRDAQADAVKTYLFLKVACGNRPLWKLYAEGAFTSYDPYELGLTGKLRDAMAEDPAVLAMYEYLDDAEMDARALMESMQTSIESIDAAAFFRELLYGVSYTDYLFSLPMGAGKTYLMAAFIYLDLYFRMIEPDNPAFARNFVVFAPSGLKSSVVPSLRTIRAFDPAWLFGEETAATLRGTIKFEVLDERASAKRSNRTKNPNAQKVALHQPYEDCTGLVLVTNAEKVILDRVVVDEGGSLVMGERPDERLKVENELRDVIGRLPALSIIIDEVHHAATDDIKLRAVVNQWVAEGRDVCGVLGFSGTPYLPKKQKVEVAAGKGFKSGTLANVVYYYPLANGIGNFLKRPRVDIVSGDSADIVRVGVERFLREFGDVRYEDGTLPKLAIFCGGVVRLEEEVYPQVCALLAEHGLDASEAVLRYHRGGSGAKKYPVGAEWATEFAMLDTPASRKRIVLLAQIGKEGWDCKSLAGVVLSQEGDCKKNMVLQTSCRCLREVTRSVDERALIVLNAGNAAFLEKQLAETQRIDLATFQKGADCLRVERTSRMRVFDEPTLEYHANKLVPSLVTSELTDEEVEAELCAIEREARARREVASVEDLDFAGERSYGLAGAVGAGLPVTFTRWSRELVGEFGGGPERLRAWAASADGCERLRRVFEALTLPLDGSGGGERAAGEALPAGTRAYRAGIDQVGVRSRIRALFYPRTRLTYELGDAGAVCQAVLDEPLLGPSYGSPRENFYPSEEVERDIIAVDAGGLSAKILATIETLREAGMDEAAEELAAKSAGGGGAEGLREHNADIAYHYIPYRFGSPFEEEFFRAVLGMEETRRLGLEVYYNGDRSTPGLRLDCFERNARGSWRGIGVYTPDFLVVQREGASIARALIVETKGAGYEGEERFVKRRLFMEGTFVPEQGELEVATRYEYLVLSDAQGIDDARNRIREAYKAFFAA